MKPTKHDLRSSETLDLFNRVAQEADGPFAAMIRHSARHYPDSPELEAFMTLSEEGKDFAFSLGKALPKSMKPRLYASYITRCLETADLIGKGFAVAHGIFPEHTVVADKTSPFYMRDISTAVRRQREVGYDTYLRMWLDGRLPEEEVMDPHQAAESLCQWMVERLDVLVENEIAIGVSHDWNLFPVKEHILQKRHEEVGQVGYLEAIVVYRNQGKLLVRGIEGCAEL